MDGAEQFDGAVLAAPPWRKPRREKPPRPPVTQDLIVTTAIRVLDGEGLDAVSMRRVAQELDTGAATLYAHVFNKDELLELMYDRVIGEIELPEPDPAHWKEQIRELAWGIYRVLSAHSDIARVSLAHIPTGVNSLRLGERVLDLLLPFVSPKTAAWAIDRLLLYIGADAYESSLYQLKQRASGKDVESFVAGFLGQVREYFANLPPAHFPHTVEHVDDIVSADGDERFDFGLELFIEGLAATVDRQARHKHERQKSN